MPALEAGALPPAGVLCCCKVGVSRAAASKFGLTQHVHQRVRQRHAASNDLKAMLLRIRSARRLLPTADRNFSSQRWLLHKSGCVQGTVFKESCKGEELSRTALSHNWGRDPRQSKSPGISV
eukprot:2007182-Rhodomonas_salina.2